MKNKGVAGRGRTPQDDAGRRRTAQDGAGQRRTAQDSAGQRRTAQYRINEIYVNESMNQ